MGELEQALKEKLVKYSESEFHYIDTKDVKEAANIDYECTGIYMESTVVYLEIKNVPYILKEHGRRKAAQVYTMLHTVLVAAADIDGGFVNCFSPNAFLVVFPGKEESIKKAVMCAMRISYSLSDAFKHQFNIVQGMEFAMGVDHGHIMGTKNFSDSNYDHLSWFGSCIHKAMCICNECARPFYIGVSGSIYHNLEENLRIAERRILGIKKKVDIWTKVSYKYDNVKKHLFQTNHKISLDEA